jgi:hypothetical protein
MIRRNEMARGIYKSHLGSRLYIHFDPTLTILGAVNASNPSGIWINADSDAKELVEYFTHPLSSIPEDPRQQELRRTM